MKSGFLNRKAIFLVLALVVLCMSCVSSFAATAKLVDDPHVVLRFGTVMTESSIDYEAAKRLKDILAEESNIELEIYTSAALGGEADMVEGMQAGIVDLGAVSPAIISNFIPDFSMFAIPYLVDGYEHAKKIWDSDIGDALKKQLTDRQLECVMFGDFGFRNLTNSQRSVRTPNDIKGLKIRVMQSEMPLDTWKALGAETVPMNITEVFTALQTGVIDGQENPTTAIFSNSFYEVQKYLSLTKHQYAPFTVLIGKSAIDRLSAEQWKKLKEAGARAQEYQVKRSAERAEEDLLKLKELGMEVNEIDLDAFRAAVEPVYKKYDGAYGKGVLDRIQNELR